MKDFESKLFENSDAQKVYLIQKATVSSTEIEKTTSELLSILNRYPTLLDENDFTKELCKGLLGRLESGLGDPKSKDQAYTRFIKSQMS